MDRHLQSCIPPLFWLLATVTGVSAANEASENLDPLDSLNVIGTRDLTRISAEIDALEDKFYDRYNQLNDKREFDVHCGRIVRTGTLLSSRTCRVNFEADALQQEGAEAYQLFQYVQEQHAKRVPNPRLPGAPPSPAIARILARAPEFRDNLRRVVSEHPELLALLKERSAKLAEHEAVRRSRRAESGN
jgi:hypothetical protein